jgi:polyisoprenoid-binding protein YceI
MEEAAMNRSVFAGLAAVAALAPSVGRAEPWTIDPVHTGVFFSVKHMMVANVRGEFGKVSGTVAFDAKDPSKTVIDVTIDPSTVNTRDSRRDGDLKSDHFLDVAKFPTLTFKSTKVEKAPKGFKVTGDLTMHGVTKSVVLDVEGPTAEWKDPMGNLKVGAEATGKLSRADWGLKWNVPLANNGVLVGDEVGIHIEVELQKAAPPQKPAPKK